MSQFEPCPACQRHVVTAETVCPFCAAPLPESFRSVARLPPRGRMSRAALLAAGAGATLLSACFTGSSAYGVAAPYDAGSTGQGGAGGGGSAPDADTSDGAATDAPAEKP
jgi:hypothetical protein